MPLNHPPNVQAQAVFHALVEAQREWSIVTQGPPRPGDIANVVAHLHEEAEEALANPADLTEWADIIILALDGAWRAGFWGGQLYDAIAAKMALNRRRQWPDWRTHEPGTPMGHLAAWAPTTETPPMPNEDHEEAYRRHVDPPPDVDLEEEERADKRLRDWLQDEHEAQQEEEVPDPE